MGVRLSPLIGVQKWLNSFFSTQREAKAIMNADTLELAFSCICRELAASKKSTFRVLVEGRPGALHPQIREEVYRIGCEALLNAARHSAAHTIQIEIQYSPTRLRLVITDDGDGMTPESLAGKCHGYSGLSQIRDRADRIGAKLKLSSRVGAGTEVELTIPPVRPPLFAGERQ
jgi:signal transduction histidine kinase